MLCYQNIEFHAGLALVSVGLEGGPAVASATNRSVVYPAYSLAGTRICTRSPPLYRSAQPTAEGMANLKKLGIKTVLTSARFTRQGRTGLHGTGLQSISMKTWDPEEEDVVRSEIV